MNRMIMSKKYILGLVFILLVTIIWSLASVITQFIYVNEKFQSPLLLTYISSSMFSMYLILWQILIRLGYAKDIRRNDNNNDNSNDNKKDLTLYNPLVHDDSIDSTDSTTNFIDSQKEFNNDNDNDNDSITWFNIRVIVRCTRCN